MLSALRVTTIAMDKEKINEVIEAMELDIPDSCFDGWHTHADLHGEGNSDWEKRKGFIKNLIDFYNELKNRLTNFDKQYQLWIWILESDSGQDAVFFSAEHPNNKRFPVTIDKVDNTGVKNADLKKYLYGLGFEVIVDVYEGELQYYLFDKNVGVSLNDKTVP
jgi:hypothetical protein